MSGTLSVLHVDDEPDVLDLSTRLLGQQGPRLSVVTAASGPEGIATLENHRVDCIVSDSIRMPDGEPFIEAASRKTDAPIVLFTAKEWDEVAAAAIAAEVSEYVRKADTDDYGYLRQHVLRLVDPDRRTGPEYRLIGSHDFCAHNELSVSLARAVETVSGGDLTDSEPLYDAVDPDALEQLFEPVVGRPEAASVEVSFTYHELDLVVRGDGSILTSSSI